MGKVRPIQKQSIETDMAKDQKVGKYPRTPEQAVTLEA